MVKSLFLAAHLMTAAKNRAAQGASKEFGLNFVPSGLAASQMLSRAAGA
jgi:hypothetical protein